MSECPHGLDETWCAACLDRTRPKAPPTPTGNGFAARYDGWCRACAEPIEVGDMIVHSEDDGGYVHEGCA